MADRPQQQNPLLRRWLAAYLNSPRPVFLAGSGMGVAVAIVLLLALGGI